MSNEADIQGALRELNGKVGGLISSVDMMKEQGRTQEVSATAGRQRLHDKIETVRQEVGIDISVLSMRVDRLTDKVTAVEPAMKAFEKEELRQEGAKRLGARLWAAMVLAAGLAGWGVHEAINWFFRH